MSTRSNIKQYAWQRYMAKLIDLTFHGYIIYLVCFVVGIVCTLLSIPLDFLERLSSLNKVIDRILTAFTACIFTIPLMHRLWGTTLGKKIWGITVCDLQGNSLGFKESLEREVMVFFRGLIFTPFSVIYQYWAFTRNDTTSWDKDLNLIVSYVPCSIIPFLTRLVISIIMVVSGFALDFYIGQM